MLICVSLNLGGLLQVDGTGGKREPRRYYCAKNRSAFYARAYDEQGGHCVLCDQQDSLVIDRCHSTGLMRGLLCNKHNTAIRLLNADPAVFRQAADYLERFVATKTQPASEITVDELIRSLLRDAGYPSDRARARKLAEIKGISEVTAQTKIARSRKRLLNLNIPTTS